MYNGIQFKAAQNIYCARTTQKKSVGRSTFDGKLLFQTLWKSNFGHFIWIIWKIFKYGHIWTLFVHIWILYGLDGNHTLGKAN